MNDSDLSSICDEANTWKKNVNVMKERLKLRCEEASFEGIREIKLYHGLKLICSTPLMGEFLDICFCNDSQEYFVLDNGFVIHKFSMQGKPIQPPFTLSSTMVFTKIIWCQEAKIFAGFVPHDDLIWILESNFQLVQVVRNEFRVENIVYTCYTNEIIVIGSTRVTRIPLEQRDQTINPWKTINLLDSSFGPTWKLEYSSLIQHDPQFLKLAGSYLTTIYIIPLTCDKDEDSNVPVKFLGKKINASESTITALYFHCTSQWIITGDQKGNILAWNLNLECMMNCPNGHRATIKLIIGHPSICGFISSSDDDILQVWSCNLREKIESFNELGKVSSIALNESSSSIATLGVKLNCFQMHQLYTFYSPLTGNPVKLFSTMSPINSTRLIVYSVDQIVRILLATSGQQVNVQFLQSHSPYLSMAYSVITDRLYTVTKYEILVSNTKLYPMETQEKWDSIREMITCIVIYDHYEEICRIDRKQKKNVRVINPVSTRVIVGTESGELISIEETSGRQESRILAHDGIITNLHSSMISHQIISVSMDNSLKIWRIFSDISMPLVLLHCLYYVTPITCIGALGFTICYGSSTKFSQFHQLLMYDSVKKKQLEHHPSKDHIKEILALASSESLKICVTSSMDGTFRVWDDQNDLIKILEINIYTKQITFSSRSGDIVFSAGKHLYRLPHENYLSPKYRLKIVSKALEEKRNEEIITYDMKIDQTYMDNNMIENIETLLHPVSSVPLGSLDPTAEVPRLEAILQEQMCVQLKYKDHDILGIKGNILQAKRTVKKKAVMEYYDWQKHVTDLVTDSSKIEREIIIPQNISNYIGNYKIFKKIRNKSQILNIFHAYWMEKLSEYTMLPLTIDELCSDLHGFIPNSLVIRVAARQDIQAKPSDERLSIPLKKNITKYIYPPEINQSHEKDGSN